MAEERILLTSEGYAKLKQDLDELLNQTSAEMAEQLRDAHDDTDFGEEATFFDAMQAKELLDQRISRLRYILKTAELIGEDPDLDRVDPGDRVTVWDFEAETEAVFDLFGSEEVAHGRRGVSIESPVGRALLGRRVGDIIEVVVPDGVARYAIRSIIPLAHLKP